MKVSTAIGHNKDMAKLWFKTLDVEAIFEEIGQSLDISAFDIYRNRWGRIDGVSPD